MKQFINLLGENKFVLADQNKDFGTEIPYVYYVVRKTGGIYDYVSLVFYEGKFCEAAYELYMTEKNTRKPKGVLKQSEMAKKGFASLQSSLIRSFKELEETVHYSNCTVIMDKANQLFEILLLSEKPRKPNE